MTPGVYFMLDHAGKVLYVGKAVNLRSRVRSYFRNGGDGRVHIRFLVPKVVDVRVIATDTETEALILENNLIKEHRPRYNVMFRDDKTYVSLKLNVRDRWPRLTVVRRHGRDEHLYFGPYASAQAVRQTLHAIQRIFPIRSCTDSVFKNRTRPCLYHQIGQCVAPCVEGYTTEAAYRELVEQVILFLRGRSEDLIEVLRRRMQDESEALRFEEAGRIHRRIQAIAHTVERQKITSQVRDDQDIYGLYREGEVIELQCLTVRGGKLLGGRNRSFSGQLLPSEELLSSYLNQSYAAEGVIPPEILVPLELEDAATLGALLSERSGRRVVILRPQRGEKRQLVDMACRNARVAFEQRQVKAGDDAATLAQVQSKLHLRALPRKIECFDISNIQGTNAVGSMVRFVNGAPDKKGYRTYRVRTVEGANDFAMMAEVLGRRYRRALEEDDLPDLLLVDGGKGQLGMAVEVMRQLGISSVDLAGIAKSRLREGVIAGRRERSEERIFLVGRVNPVTFNPNSSALFLLQRVRDEAHRFAITAHRKLRRRQSLTSALEEIPGIGAKRKQALLRAFGSLRGVTAATIEQLAAVPGMTSALSEEVHRSLAPLSPAAAAAPLPAAATPPAETPSAERLPAAAPGATG
ncbi:MAG: excinuclease ABC subunit UvrC [Candidatus Tectomicrobia bacterium]|nr:excinuclease ABC subunit UvrC [Candidatus Tectomicrobia bacterium]